MIAASGIAAPVREAAALVAEIGECKRVRSASSRWSVAGRGFRRSWAALLAGEDPAAVALRETAGALAAARLGAIDGAVLERCGLAPGEAVDVLAGAFDAVAGGIAEPLRGALRGALRDAAAREPVPEEAVPWWVDALCVQPRAGATRPGHPRLVLEPAESHAEHCWVVAVGAVLAAEPGTRPGRPFVCGLSHHFHNATLPDSGFAGEVLLGTHLDRAIATATALVVDALPDSLRGAVRGARELLDPSPADAAAPADAVAAARAFHAADVLDRVLQQRYHASAAAFTLDHALEDLELVHEGPLQAYGLAVLDAAGLR